MSEPVTAAHALDDDDTDRSTGQLLGDVTRSMTTLLRQEVALAKAEVKDSGTRAGKGIGLFAGAGIAAILLLVFLSVSAWWGLGNHIGYQWSALIVAAAWAVVAVVLVLVGRSELQRINGLPETQQSVKKIPNAVRGREEANS